MLKPAQLEALVAPIALYPDELLANVLAASTYPLEVVQADRWLKERKTLKGDALKAEVEKQSWDDSVKALASTAEVLTMMSDKLDWTKALGDAVLAQQPDVMDAVQRLRTKAYDNNKLVTTKQQKVSVQTQESRQVIVIEPADGPIRCTCRTTSRRRFTGGWPYTDYPPYYFGYPSYIGAGVVAAGPAARHRLGDRALGQLLGGRLQLGQPQRLYQSPNHQHCKWLAAQSGASPGRAVQQRQRPAALRQQQFEGRRVGPHGFPRPRRKPGVGPSQVRETGCWRSCRRPCGRSWRQEIVQGIVPGIAVIAPAMGAAGGGGRGDRAKGGGDRAKGRRRSRQGRQPRRRRRCGQPGRWRQSRRCDERFPPAGRPRQRRRADDPAWRACLAAAAAPASPGAAVVAEWRCVVVVVVASVVVGGGGGRGGGGGGRRSDIALKHDVVLLGHLASGLGYYRFSYIGSHKAYVGVMAQEVEQVVPGAVTRGSDGYLRVYYDKLGLKFRTYSDWLAAGAKIPAEVSP